ncbi:hypothetical protein [Glycomyces tarimensis]
MSTDPYRYEGRGFVVGPDLVEEDTTELRIVRAAAPAQLAETSHDADRAALLDTLDQHTTRIRELAATNDTDGTRERIHGAIAALQQLDANVAEANRAKRDKETAKAFNDWATGGEQR